MSSLINDSTNDQIQLLEQKIENIKNEFIIIDQSIYNNLTDIENRIISNFSKADQNLYINTTTLDRRIYTNITSLKNDIKVIQIAADTNLLLNTTVLDWRIFNNISQLNSTFQNVSLKLRDINDSLLKQKEAIQKQQNTINNLTYQINCTSNLGFSIINGSCIQLVCPISGQQSINGICQCININQIVKNGYCVCPLNSQVVRITCICNIGGQVMLNGQCVCSTTGAIVMNDVCTCGVNSSNISNTCSCPSGASLVNGVCTCTNINAYISGNQCVCPTYSSLVENTCACPSNSQIVNNICTCNQISGQIMNNGLCQCQTVGAFVDNGTCSCGVNALNVSNICTCPTNSSLVNNFCTCDKIIGQLILNGVCQCPTGQSVVLQTCQQIYYIINISTFECSQELFTQQFDIQSITHKITAPSNFSSGYIFGTATVIQNAFIDISDNIYSTVVYPLFQSQNSFTNLKIQFGTQSLNSGSLLLSSFSVSINLMNIISRHGSQLTVNSAKQLNIFTSTSFNSNISSLLINLSFAPSSGQITLISNINGVFSISGYHVLGTYISTETAALIGLNVNSATVSVNQVSFKPTIFNVGNISSYLFGYAMVMCTIQINNFSIILGHISNFILLSSIYTTSTANYLFGGIIAYINSSSVVNVNNVIIDSYQQFSTSYVRYSGFLVGYNPISSSSIVIQNVCLQQNITSTTKFYNFGLIGCNQGNTSVRNTSVAFAVQGAYFEYFGIIGIQNSGSIYAEIVNSRTSVSVSTGNYYVGSIFGFQQAQNCSVQNISITEGNISGSTYNVGGFIGEQSSNVTVMNSSIQQTNISGSNQVGGFVGYLGSSGQLYLINSKIQSVCLKGSSSIGIVGFATGTINFTNSSSAQIYVNDVLIGDCITLSNWQSGC
ncbi:Conserved_hypothetical protein [Hexamita inflata]|uniref:Uncharacterized protein n=1 Tax=Hexamita inflata TaxID=28002 RepID=A0AA86NAE2_9EUKA|nr:Conserved hypothetical protein [Hexamita inflata]